MSLTVPSFAAEAETVYNITDFDISMFQIATSSSSGAGQTYDSTIAFDTISADGFNFTRVYNTNSDFYAQSYVKNTMALHITNLSLKDEYNLNFHYKMFAQIKYSITVFLQDEQGNNLAPLFQDVVESGNFNRTGECNVNFTLENLGFTTNQGISLVIWVVVGDQFQYNYRFGFTDITLINLDDDSGLLDSILNWLSRIYHSIAGGTDREGVNHPGIVQGISNALTNVKNAITAKIDAIEQWFIDLKDNIVDGLKSLFIPRDGYFAEKKTQLETFATQHFGALYQGPDVMIDLIRKLLTVDPSSNPGITMPAIEFDFQGQHYTLTEPIHYSFSWVNDSSHPLYYFYHIYRGFVTVILFVGFGNYLVKKYRDVFEGGGDGE